MWKHFVSAFDNKEKLHERVFDAYQNFREKHATFERV